MNVVKIVFFFFFFQAEDGIRDRNVTGVQTCALPILTRSGQACAASSILVVVVGGASLLRMPGLIVLFLGLLSVALAAVVAKIGRASCRERGVVLVAVGASMSKVDLARRLEALCFTLE